MIYAELEINTGGVCSTTVASDIHVPCASSRILRAVGADKERLNGLLGAEAKTIIDDAIVYIERNRQHLTMLDLDYSDLVLAAEIFLTDLRRACIDHPKASVYVRD
jgi:hypothetical protein